MSLQKNQNNNLNMLIAIIIMIQNHHHIKDQLIIVNIYLKIKFIKINN